MSTRTSIAPTVAATLATLLEEQLIGLGQNGANPVVQQGFAAQYSTWDTVIVGDQIEGVHTFHALRAGRKPREEQYKQRIWFRVIRSGPLSTAATEAAYDQLAVLENMIAEDPKIGLNEPTLVMNVETFQCNTVSDTNGWLATIRADVKVTVRLT